MPSVGADRKTRGQRVSQPGPDGYFGLFRGEGAGLIVDPRQVRKPGRALFQRRHQRAVFDVVAKLVETDFIGRKSDLRRADQPAGIVDQAHGPQCSRLARAARPDLEAPQEIDGTAEQGRGAIVGIGQAARDQGGVRAGFRHCDRGRQPGRTTADYDDIVYAGSIVHFRTIDVPGGIFKPQRGFDRSPVCAAERRKRECANPGDS